MPRPPKPTYVKARPGKGEGYWITRAFGEFSEKTGRRKGVRNSTIGPPTGREGPANRAAAQRWVDGLAEAAVKAERRADNPTLDGPGRGVLRLVERSTRETRTVQSHAERLTVFGGFTPAAGALPYGERTASPISGRRT
jgi:hypothetical protein